MLFHHSINDLFKEKQKTDLEMAGISCLAAHTSETFPSPLRGAGGSCSAPPSPPLTLRQTEHEAPAHTNISNALRKKPCGATHHETHRAPCNVHTRPPSPSCRALTSCQGFENRSVCVRGKRNRLVLESGPRAGVSVEAPKHHPAFLRVFKSED